MKQAKRAKLKQLKQQLEAHRSSEMTELPLDPVTFALLLFGFKCNEYQAKLLRDASKRIVVRWSRQAGKTTCIALRAIWSAIMHPKTLTLIVAASMRQSMIMSDRIQDFLASLPKERRLQIIEKLQRATIRFKNGSRIVALPNSPQLLRGYTANQVICFPSSVKVLLVDGSQIPINQVKKGELVLSYNLEKERVEPREVLKVFRRKYCEQLVNICHEFGNLQCTPNHEIYTVAGKVPAISLDTTTQVLCASECFAQQQTSQLPSKTVPVQRIARGLIPFKTRAEKKKLRSPSPTRIKPSRICNVQVLADKGFCTNSSQDRQKCRMGQAANPLWDSGISCLHRSLQNVLHEWSKDLNPTMAEQDPPSICSCYLVHGRWEPGKERDINHKHAQLFSRRTLSPAKLAQRKLGCSSEGKEGFEGQRLLPPFFRDGKRQVSRADQTVPNSDYGLQVHTGSSDQNLLSLWPEVCAEKECLRNCQNSQLEPLLQPEMLQARAAKAKVQPRAYELQDMWKNLQTSHWKSSDVLPILQPSISSHEEKGEQSPVQIAKEIEVFNIEVEGNHNYFANRVLVANCDEAAFFRDDDLVFYNVLYPMLATTDGTMIASSTPWSKDSVFYRMCQSNEYSKHVVTSEDVVKTGLIKQSFIDEMRSQLPLERFQREFMAEFVEDVDAWLTQSLIVSCIDSNLQPFEFQDRPQGEFYVGVDFGKEQDFSVVSVAVKADQVLRFVHMHRFPLHTEFASVIGYLKSLQDRWQIRSVYADITGVGAYIVEDMVRSGIQGVKGVTFTVQSKEEMATILREKMRTGEVKIPYVPARKIEDVDLTAELNIEKYELMKTGHLRFSHPEGGHDDVFWSTALAVYACVQSPLPGKGAVMLPH